MNAKQDISRAFSNWRLWYYLGLYDIKQRYRRSVLGPFWLTLSVGIFVLALGMLYSRLLTIPVREHLPYVAAGYIIWVLISNILSESCTLFDDNKNLIKQVNTSYSTLVMRMIWKNTLIFLHQFPVFLIVVLFFGLWPGWHYLLVLAGIVLFSVSAACVGMVTAIFAARFRDVAPIMTTFLQVLLFVTPIMWEPRLLKGHEWVIIFNPFYHFIEIIRAPLLGHAAPALSYLIVIGLTAVAGWASYKLLDRVRYRIVFWMG